MVQGGENPAGREGGKGPPLCRPGEKKARQAGYVRSRKKKKIAREGADVP